MIDLSNYSCDKCAREFSWHCKHCWHTADKPPTRFKNKKKTGCETPEYRCPTMPPVAQPKEERKIKCVAHPYVGTKEGFNKFAERYDDLLKIDNAEIYWSDKTETIAVVTTPEWTEFLMGRSDAVCSKGE